MKKWGSREGVIAAYEESPVLTQVAKRLKINKCAAQTYIRAHQVDLSLIQNFVQIVLENRNQKHTQSFEIKSQPRVVENVELFFVATGIHLYFSKP